MSLPRFTNLSPSQSARNVAVLRTISTFSGPTSLDHNSPDFNELLVFSGTESGNATASDIPNTPSSSISGTWELIPSSSLSEGNEDDPLEDTYIPTLAWSLTLIGPRTSHRHHDDKALAPASAKKDWKDAAFAETSADQYPPLIKARVTVSAFT